MADGFRYGVAASIFRWCDPTLFVRLRLTCGMRRDRVGRTLHPVAPEETVGGTNGVSRVAPVNVCHARCGPLAGLRGTCGVWTLPGCPYNIPLPRLPPSSLAPPPILCPSLLDPFSPSFL